MISNLLTGITFLVGAIAALAVAVCSALHEGQRVRKAYSELTKPGGLIIGVVGRTFPEVLTPFPDTTKVRKARRMAQFHSVVVLHCRTLSYSLRHSDFTVCDAANDPCVISPTDSARLKAIITKNSVLRGADENARE